MGQKSDSTRGSAEVLHTAADWLGLATLLASGLCLALSLWFSDGLISGMLLHTFCLLLISAVSLWLLARSLELFAKYLRARDHRRLPMVTRSA